MKTWKKLLAALLAIAMICVLAACVNPETPAGNTATVTFMNGEEVYETVTVEIGAKLTLPKAPRGEDGKGLYGWSTIDGDVEEIIDPTTYVVEADVNLYAVWADVYTVVINPDNGTPFTVMENIFAGTVLEQPDDPVKEGFKFVEWRDALAETAFDWTQPIQGDVTIKAMYGDGSPNRVTDYKWDFTLGHGAWFGGQSGWKKDVNGILAEDMVYETTEDGYAAWGFTMTDSLENIPEIKGQEDTGFGMKFLYNEGISVDAAKAKLVVLYYKTKYFPLDVTASNGDQLRMSLLTSKGGKIYGYGTGQEDWAIRSDSANKHLIQVDKMEDGWIRVQYKIHELAVWSEDAVIKGMSFAFVQRPSAPIMDIVSLKSVELLDQEEFIDPHEINYITKNEWDMTKEEDVKDWVGSQTNGSNTANMTVVTDANGTSYTFGHSNKWRGLTMSQAKIDISKCSGIFSATVDISGMAPENYRLYIVTDAGGDLYKNSDRNDVSCYYVATSATELADGWTVTPNADGTVTVSYDMTKLEYWKNGTELQGISFVIVDGTPSGVAVYKSISLVDTVKTHNCETDGHIWKDATCTEPKTCRACGATEGEAAGHNLVDGVCTVCGHVDNPPVIQNSWDLTNADDSKQWYAYQDQGKLDTATMTVTENGTLVSYSNSNGWKGMTLKNADIAIAKLTGKLTLTYSTDLSVTQYRVYVQTDKGGDVFSNKLADKDKYYISIATGDIAASEAWTLTNNDDGTVTVTFDLKTLPYYAEGTALKGFSLVTVASGVGEITYKSIELEKNPPIVWDMKDAEDSAQWYATQNKDLLQTGSIEVTENGSVASYAESNGWKGMLLRNQEIAIAKQEGILSFTYSTELTITKLRVYVTTEQGGSLTHNDEATAGTKPANFMIELAVSNIPTNENWTSTTVDGLTTVTFNLNSLPFFASSETLTGLSIVTVASGVGSVTYTNIAIN